MVKKTPSTDIDFKGDFGFNRRAVTKSQVVGIFDLVGFSKVESNNDLVSAVRAMETSIEIALVDLGDDYWWAERTTAGFEAAHNELLLRSTGDGYVVAFSEQEKDLDALLHSHTMEGHRYIIKAPLAGIISAQTVVLGQGVSTGDHLFEIVDTRQVWVFANLPIEQAQRFKEGDLGTILAKGREPIEAPLAYIAPIADKATLTVQLRFDVDNTQGLLKPNEYVEVRLKEVASPILAISMSAPTLVEGVRGVFVKEINDYRFIPVTLGQESDGWIEVTEGLTAGDEIVIEGVFDLKNALMKDSIAGD